PATEQTAIQCRRRSRSGTDAETGGSSSVATADPSALQPRANPDRPRWHTGHHLADRSADARRSRYRPATDQAAARGRLTAERQGERRNPVEGRAGFRRRPAGTFAGAGAVDQRQPVEPDLGRAQRNRPADFYRTRLPAPATAQRRTDCRRTGVSPRQPTPGPAHRIGSTLRG